MRRVFLFLLGIVLLGVTGLGAVICGFGFEAVATGANPGPWWQAFCTLVVAPLLGAAWCAAKLLQTGTR